jgi:hypothetical protein
VIKPQKIRTHRVFRSFFVLLFPKDLGPSFSAKFPFTDAKLPPPHIDSHLDLGFILFFRVDLMKGATLLLWFALSAAISCVLADISNREELDSKSLNQILDISEWSDVLPKLRKGGGSRAGGGAKGGAKGGSSAPSASSSSSSSSGISGGYSPSPAPSRSPFAPSSPTTPSRTYTTTPQSFTSAPSPSARTYASRNTVASSAVVWSSNSRAPDYYSSPGVRPWFIVGAGIATVCASSFYSYSGSCRCAHLLFFLAAFPPFHCILTLELNSQAMLICILSIWPVPRHVQVLSTSIPTLSRVMGG